MASLKYISGLALASSQLFLGTSDAGAPATCPTNGPLSCQNTTAVANTCCFNAPGGQLLQTQFWDTDPATGPANSWTVHGLWPDHCDGTFDANCDATRAYTNITQILQSYGANSLLSYMQTYWKDYQGNDESFWEHEWAKHGTCISTFNPSCYTGYTPQEEVVDFFNKTVALFQTLPSYTLLSNAGILPSTSKNYTLSAVQAALAKGHDGHIPTINCASGALDEIWYHYNVRGSVQTGQFVAADPDGSKSTCPASFKYMPKSGAAPTGSPTTTTTAPTGTSPPGTPFSGKGTLSVDKGGCIISGGTWYTSGTCASFTATPSGSGFTLKSSKGLCAVTSGTLSCASTITAGTVFSQSGGKLLYSGSSAFYAKATPSGSVQETVYTGSQAVAIAVSWQAVKEC